MPAISAITIFVTDLASARQFYCQLLGFTEEAQYGPELVKLRHEHCSLLLCLCAATSRPGYPVAAQVTLGFAVPDVAAQARRLGQAGVEMVFAEPADFPAGKFIAVRDPSGNVIEFLQYNR